MGVMTAQQVLPMTMVPGVVRVGAAADLLEGSGGGEVFIHGNLTYAWSGDDQALRRLTAVQLVEMQVARSAMSPTRSVSTRPRCGVGAASSPGPVWAASRRTSGAPRAPRSCCLLYTSDAADEEDSVDLGGR